MEIDDQAISMVKLDTLAGVVQQYFRIDDYILGSPRQNFVIQYHGHFISESSQAYDKIAASVQTLGLVPLFRIENDRQTIYIVDGLPEPKPSNVNINLILFVITVFTVMLTGALYGLEEPLPAGILETFIFLVERGWPFAVSLLAILGAHEFGHYLVGRYHKEHVTLPYFIPFPLSPFGTMGAFINMKRPPKNRRALLDIGIAGPFSGLVIAIPVLILGLSLSTVDILPATIPEGISLQVEGNSILYLLAKFLVFGRLLPAPADLSGIPLIHFWLGYFFTGHPAPLGSMDVLLHPVAWAGWAGILITGLNLLPAGQLDGGHMLYVLFGKKTASRILPFVLAGLVLLGFAWSGWWLWAVLIFFLGRSHAEPMDQVTPLERWRKVLAVLALVLFFLTFTPVPLSLLY